MTWYAIRTSPQREMTVHAMLHRKGYAVYLPVETRERRRAKGGRDEISVPMFSGYLFVRYPFSWPHLRADRGACITVYRHHLNLAVSRDGHALAEFDLDGLSDVDFVASHVFTFRQTIGTQSFSMSPSLLCQQT